jgi:hypothetical protein
MFRYSMRRKARWTAVILAAATAASVASAMSAGAATKPTSTISSVQFAKRADSICGRDARQQARLGSPLLNADIVTEDHLPRAAAFLDKIIVITRTEIGRLHALPPTHTGMHERRLFVAAIAKILADERHAAAAADRGDLEGFRSTFDRFLVRGRPTGPDYVAAIRAFRATAELFPFKVCGHTGSVYP